MLGTTIMFLLYTDFSETLTLHVKQMTQCVSLFITIGYTVVSLQSYLYEFVI